jgi:hypothetical protein
VLLLGLAVLCLADSLGSLLLVFHALSKLSAHTGRTRLTWVCCLLPAGQGLWAEPLHGWAGAGAVHVQEAGGACVYCQTASRVLACACSVQLFVAC